MKHAVSGACVGALFVVLAGCKDSGEGRVPTTSKASDSISSLVLDTTLSGLIRKNNLSGDASEGRTIPTIDSPLAQLGMHLFFSKSLGGDQDVGCVSCHHPALGGGDDLSLPIGIHSDTPDLLGPGRTIAGTSIPNVPRNAPTTFNIALWDSALFLDGRVESLTRTPGVNGEGGDIRTPDSAFGQADPLAGLNLSIAQTRFPVTSVEEMRGSLLPGDTNEAVRTHLAERLDGTNSELQTPDTASDADNLPDWPTAFAAAFSDPQITYARIGQAIAAYEQSQVFVDTPWKAYIEGDTGALTLAQKEGAVLFYTPVAEGGAGCAGCHSGDFMTDELFHNIGMVQVGPGKGNGPNSTGDFGRFRETGVEADRFAFRTPTLLNVAVTGPYGHAGSYDDLEGVIRHHLNASDAVDDFFASAGTWCQQMAQFTNIADCDALYPNAESDTRSGLDKLIADQTAGTSRLSNAALDDSQVASLVAFMEALTDPCLTDASCLAPWIPDTSTLGLSDLQLNGINGNHQPLLTN
ncbi:cytochrome-c peroxidase [Marinobacter mobilis]|uniref:cytochrome-c peroxidase n=1 Tax=Marinobacter mobilis TaxID=488533 RepID=UPI0035C7808F